MPRETDTELAESILNDTLGADFLNGPDDLEDDDVDTQPGPDDTQPGPNEKEDSEDELNKLFAQEDEDDETKLRTGKLGEDKTRVSHTKQFRQAAEVKPDGKGNLVNAQGQVVAKAGKEARLYQDAHNARQKAAQVEQRAQAAQNDLTNRLNEAVSIGTKALTELKAIKEQGNEASKLGLNPQQHLEALQLFKEGLDNPVQLLKKLLTRAAANGIDMAQLGLAQGAIDPKAFLDQMRGEIDKLMNPLKERSAADQAAQEQRQKQEQENNEAFKAVQGFFDQNPEAKKYLPVFQRIYNDPRFAKMSIDQAWDKIQLNLLRQSQENRGDGKGPRNPSMPSGRRTMPSAEGGEEEIAPVTMQYGDILKDVLKETGYGS